jgi:thiol-disulfide isomerase/thioredoxin
MNARFRLARSCLACAAVAMLALAGCKRDAVPPAATTAAPAAAPAARSPASPQPRKDGADPMPVLEVATVDGKRWRLADHRGHWVVVNYWATWCGPCLKEMPELSALDAMREDVDVVGLAYEDIAPADLEAFLGKHPVVYPVAVVDVYSPPPAFDAPRGLPTTWLVAPDGRVARHFLGPVTAADLEAAIAKGPPAA